MRMIETFEELLKSQIPIYVLPNKVNKFRKKKQIQLFDCELTPYGVNLWFKYPKGNDGCFTLDGTKFYSLWNEGQIEIEGILLPTK